MTIVVTCIAVLVLAWAFAPAPRRNTPNIEQRVSRDDLATCARIAARRLKQIANA